MELIKNNSLWYGEYGGCFVADAFSLHCDEYYQQFSEVIKEESFKKEFDELAHKYLGEFKKLDENTVLVPENYYAIVGTSLLCKRLGKSLALAACRFVDEALLTATIAKELGLTLKMSITEELSGIETLITKLKIMGVQVESEKCKTLINAPELYVFQEWLSGSSTKHIINTRANTGAFPQPNIALYFLEKYKKDFEDFLKKENMSYKKLIMPVVSGSLALSLIDENKDVEYVGVECDSFDDLREEEDSFCGTWTKVMRNNYVDRVICAKLSDYYEKKRVERVNMTIKDLNGDILTAYTPALTLQSYAVLSLPKDGLRVVKAHQEGSNL